MAMENDSSLSLQEQGSQVAAPACSKRPRHPHFDENRVVWRDEYSGQYEPPSDYSAQFDLQWKIALEGTPGYYQTPGASVEDAYIDDRVYEWTGKHPRGAGFADSSSGVRVLDHPIDPQLIRGKKAVDIGCGMGRWTRTIQALGAKSVLSVDISESALQSVSRFNDNVVRANIMEIPKEHPEWVEAFDFAVFWGVAMCTHDPLKAFFSAASTVKPGGALYLMVYSPEGIHHKESTNLQRKYFHSLTSVEERLSYVDRVWARKLQRNIPLSDNLANMLRNLLRRPKGSKTGVLDMLEPYYNWVIPLDVVEGWMRKGGFDWLKVLNEFESPKCAFHVVGSKKMGSP